MYGVDGERKGVITMIDQTLWERIAELQRELRKEMRFISDFLYKNPELGLEEYLAVEMLCDVAQRHGMTVSRHTGGMETAFVAAIDNGPGPTIAFIAEYDALPGFGPEGGPGHACGHNWISATSMGAAMILAQMREDFRGKVLLMGTPAMENYGGKVDLVRNHVFDQVDAVIEPHLEQQTSLDCKSRALDAIQFDFRGKAAHSAIYKEQGINALDGVQFLFQGVNALKNHLREDVNINGIITEGGKIPSVIPEMASCKFYIRAAKRPYLNEVTRKVIRCAEGAALMAGAEVSWHNFENSSDDLLNNKVLEEVLREYMALEDITPVSQDRDTAAWASDDIGNVSYVCPTVYVEFGMDAPDEFRIHDASAMKYVNSQLGGRKMDQVSRILAGTALELFQNPTRLEEARSALRQEIHSEPF